MFSILSANLADVVHTGDGRFSRLVSMVLVIFCDL